MIHSVLHAISVFFNHLAAVDWKWLALGIACHLCKLLAVSRAWRNIVAAAYPDRAVRWRQMFGAYVAGTGVNAVIPARGGDVVRLYLAKHRIEGSTYTTLVSTSLLQTLFDMARRKLLHPLGGHAARACRARTFCSSPSLPALDYGWAFRHPVAGLILFGLLLLFGTALVAWIAERVEEFKAKVAQGFAAFRDRSYYLRHVVSWQLLDWSLRLATVFFFLTRLRASGHAAQRAARAGEPEPRDRSSRSARAGSARSRLCSSTSSATSLRRAWRSASASACA